MLSSIVGALPPRTQSIEADSAAAGLDLEYLSNQDLHDETMQLAIQYTKNGDIDLAGALLRVLQYRAIKHQALKEFYMCFESIVDMLPQSKLALLTGNLFDMHQPHFVDSMTTISEGHWSINFLRIINSFLRRLDSKRFGLERGIILRVLAKVKGFAHPARLNKKGQQFKVKVFEETHENDRANGPEELIQYLNRNDADPARVSGALRYATDKVVLNNDLMNLVVETCSSTDPKLAYESSTDCDWSGFTYAQMNVSLLYRLIAELSIYARKQTEVGAAISVSLEEMIHRISGKIRSLQARSADRTSFSAERLLTLFSLQNRVEPLWEKWKESGCPKIELPDAGIALVKYPAEESLTDAFAELEPLTKATDDAISRDFKPMDDLLVCNEKVTNILKSEVTFESFKTKDSTKDTPVNAFQRLRSLPWARIVEQYRDSPINENARTKELEQKMLTEEEDARRKKDVESSERERKRAAESEVGNKRQMLYSDDRRARGAEITAKPLPY